MKLAIALSGAVLVTGAPPARDDRIIRRHDQPDSLYIALGRGYPALAHINLPTPKGAADGEGALIAPHWVVTAAHVGAEVRRGHRITVGGADYTVDSIVIHPSWNDGPPGGPAFLQGVEGPVLVGVSSGQSSRATGGQRGRYDVVEYYVRVSRYVAWIESITGRLSF